MTINELYLNEEISIRSYNVCKSCNLRYISDLVKYYHKNRTFINLRNCGTKSNKELIDICIKYGSLYFKNSEEHSVKRIMTIHEVYLNEEINLRSYNVCQSANLYYMSDLVKYYHKNRTFINLRNCGTKSNNELISICIKYDNEYFENSVEFSVKNNILNLTQGQADEINRFILLSVKLLSRRSRAAIASYLGGDFTLESIYKKILVKTVFNFRDFSYIGLRHSDELDGFVENIKKNIYKVVEASAIDLGSNVGLSLNQKHTYLGFKEREELEKKNILAKKISYEFPSLLISTETIEMESIFLFMDSLLSQNILFKSTQTYVFLKAFKIYQNQEQLSYSDIADVLNKGYEWVRQIVKKISLSSLHSKLSIVKLFKDKLFERYSIDINLHEIRITPQQQKQINDLNGTDFTIEFITYILSVYLQNSFSIVGNYEDVLIHQYPKVTNRHKWNNICLIKKELASEFDFNSLTNDVLNRINDRIEESYSFNFKSYLSKFLTNNKIDFLDMLSPICEKIINEEFELYLDLNGDLNFERTKKRLVYEYAFEALELLGKPSRVKDIIKKIIEYYPDFDTNERKIAASMKRTRGFVPISRTNVYGLKKWENEFESFRGGTIREIAKEYLDMCSTPKHISDITKYVLKYRPKTNERSILTNLKIATKENRLSQFVSYKDSHIGLNYKKYESSHEKLLQEKKTDKKTWEERFEMLRNFIAIEKRLPFSSGVTDNEIKLYRWINVQKSKLQKGKLEKIKGDKLNSLLERYLRTKIRRSLYSDNGYKELISFVSNNNRLPNAKKFIEKDLYEFYYRQKNLFDKDKLEAKAKIEFIKVARILKQKHNEELVEWESKLLYWSKYKKEGYKYSPKKEAWWKKK